MTFICNKRNGCVAAFLTLSRTNSVFIARFFGERKRGVAGLPHETHGIETCDRPRHADARARQCGFLVCHRVRI